METMKKMVVIIITILLGLLLIFQIVHAEIYKWVDEKGTVNFTEDPATIPEKYRDKAKSRTTEEDLMTPEERARTRRKHEEEVRERLKREKNEYGLKEFEKRVKEMEDQAKKKQEEGRCEIVSYSQYDIVSDVSGSVTDGHGSISSSKSTCVDLVIKNNTPEAKTITERNLVATSSKSGKTFNPKAVFIRIGPGETYRGSICFKSRLDIAKLGLQGL